MVMAMQQYIHLHRTQFNKRQHESRLTIRNLLHMGDAWGISKKQVIALLGASSLQQLGQWSEAAGDLLLTEDQIETASYLLALHAKLERELKRPKVIRDWLKTPLPDDAPTMGQTPLDYLIEHKSKLIASRTIHQWIETNKLD